MRKNNIAISVIVPVYNVEKWLDRCINSILLQSFKNFELLLVNDGSTDNSIEICNNYLKSDERISVFNKKNGGLSDARNYGLSYAKGKYIVFVDSDDYIQENYLFELYHGIHDNDAEVAVCGYNTVTETGMNIDNIIFPNKNNIISGQKLLKLAYLKNGFVYQVVWNKIYNRNLFEKMEFQKGRYYEDEYLLVPLFWKISKVALIDKCLYNYVQRSGSITSSSLSRKKIYDMDGFRKQRIDFIVTKSRGLLLDLAVNEYKEWIIDTCFRYKQLLKKEDIVYFQNKYKNLCDLNTGSSLRWKIEDLFAKKDILLAGKITKNFKSVVNKMKIVGS